jgi:hypothetical protein
VMGSDVDQQTVKCHLLTTCPTSIGVTFSPSAIT